MRRHEKGDAEQRAAAQVLGWEGFWGTVAMAVVGLPLAWLLPGPDIGAHTPSAAPHSCLAPEKSFSPC